MASGGIFEADPEAVKRGGANLKRAGEVAATILGDLKNVIAQYPNAGGDGPIGDAVHRDYDRSAVESMEFLDGLNTLITTDGQRTMDLGTVFDDTDTAATINANGGGKVH